MIFNMIIIRPPLRKGHDEISADEPGGELRDPRHQDNAWLLACQCSSKEGEGVAHTYGASGSLRKHWKYQLMSCHW